MAIGFFVANARMRLGIAARVVKAQDVPALYAARDLLARCQAVRAQLVRSYLRLRARARARGYEAGRRAALAAAAERLAATELRAARYLASLDAAVVELVLGAVRRIVPTLDPAEVVAAAAAAALREMRAERWLRIRVHPDARAGVEARLRAAAREHRPPEFAQLVDDPELDARACVLESEVGQVHADLELQLAAIRAAMLAAAAQARAGSAAG
jgi:type III secretion protein L